MEVLLPFSIWSSISPWLSPSMLFLFLNIVIGTIALTSKLYHFQTTDSDHINDLHRLVFSRQPSVLERLKSFNLSLYPHSTPKPQEEEEEEEEDKFKEEEDQHQDSGQVLSRPPSFLERIRSFKLYPDGSDGDVVVEKTDHISRNQSNPSRKRTGKKLIRSASEGTEFLKADQEDEYGRRVMTMRGGDRKNQLDLSSDDEEEEKEENINGGEVDARADDFISKFRQQLKLQRLDSILRFTEMLNRGK